MGHRRYGSRTTRSCKTLHNPSTCATPKVKTSFYHVSSHVAQYITGQCSAAQYNTIQYVLSRFFQQVLWRGRAFRDTYCMFPPPAPNYELGEKEAEGNEWPLWPFNVTSSTPLPSVADTFDRRANTPRGLAPSTPVPSDEVICRWRPDLSQQELEKGLECMAERIRDLYPSPVLLHPAILHPSPAGIALGPLPTMISKMFTHAILHVNRARKEVDTNPENRVTAHTIGGVQCCLPGLGEDLRFPCSWTVRSALRSGLWMRRATEEEAKGSGEWYTLLDFEPKAIVHSNGAIALDHELLGDYGDIVTVVAQPHVVPRPNVLTNLGQGAVHCPDCRVWCNGPMQWEDHLSGKTHLRYTQARDRLTEGGGSGGRTFATCAKPFCMCQTLLGGNAPGRVGVPRHGRWQRRFGR